MNVPRWTQPGEGAGQLHPIAGVTYRIGVGAFAVTKWGVQSVMAPSNPPANDNFADAPPLPTESTGSTAEATFGWRPANHPQENSGPGRAFRRIPTPHQSAVTVISLEGSSYPPPWASASAAWVR
jgi:hypothetical protein